MRLRRLRSSIKFITAVGLAGLFAILGVASALANNGPGPWP
jgi:hypothetical protein